jgi:hypothetical protein
VFQVAVVETYKLKLVIVFIKIWSVYVCWIALNGFPTLCTIHHF